MRPEDSRYTRTQVKSITHNSEGRMGPSQEPYDRLRASSPPRTHGFDSLDDRLCQSSRGPSAVLKHAASSLGRSLSASAAALVLPRRTSATRPGSSIVQELPSAAWALSSPAPWPTRQLPC